MQRHHLFSGMLVLVFGLGVPFCKAQVTLLLPARLFDGENLQEGWGLVVERDQVVAVGPSAQLRPRFPNAQELQLPNHTVLPGLIEGHGHLFLHPYNETSWNDQVLREAVAERTIRAGIHARQTLEAGFTTLRDLGTEGADYADVGLKTAIEKKIIPGPRLLIAGPAIVATGSYGPKGFAAHVTVPQGAEEADGLEGLTKTVRRQIGQGVDLIKVYADYRWGWRGEAQPTFSVEELRQIVVTAQSSGREVVAHAATAEGMRRSILAGVKTIEHGDAGTPEVFALMAARGVALCPTLAAGHAIAQYQGWKPGASPEPPRVQQKRATFQAALAAGVTICAGGDVGVFAHGDNLRELELMAAYGMAPLAILRSATTINARVFGLGQEIGSLQPGYQADLIVVEGNPGLDIKALRQLRGVMQAGRWIKHP